MNKESTPVFPPGPQQPEQRKPDILNVLKNSERRREERLSSLSKQLVSLNAIKMNGLTEEITKEKFPDVPEDQLEISIFFSDTTKAGLWMQDAKTTKDPELQRMMQRKAQKIMENRDKRMKEYLEKTDGSIEPKIPVDISKEIITTKPQNQNSNNPFGYL